MKFKENAHFGLTCFLGGVVVGFLITPIKNGIYIISNNVSNNVNNNGNHLEKDEGKSNTEEDKEL